MSGPRCGVRDFGPVDYSKSIHPHEAPPPARRNAQKSVKPESEKIGKQARSELLGVLRQRYQQAAKQDKTKILDEFLAVTGCHRKHGIRLLTGAPRARNDTAKPP